MKGLPFDGHATITVGGVQQRLDPGNREPAVVWTVERLGAQILAEYEAVPGHAHATPAEVAAPSRADWIAAFQQSNGRTWQASAGPHDPTVLAPQLPVVPAQHVRKVVFIDDVVTSGGHIEAACAVLSVVGDDVADAAFRVGRTVNMKGDPLGILVEERPRPMTKCFVLTAARVDGRRYATHRVSALVPGRPERSQFLLGPAATCEAIDAAFLTV